MNLSHLSKISVSGQGLNVEERVAMKAAILKARGEGAGQIQFWGKIFGKQRDYLICCSTDTSTVFPSKNFFYSTTGDWELKKLIKRSMNATQLALAQKLHATYKFQGDPAKPLDEERKEELKEGDEDITAADATYRELHHLAYVVWAVDNGTSIVPRGSFSINSTGALVQNPSFKGLSASSAAVLSSYYHLRPPQARASEWGNKTGAAKMEDVLDQVGASRPASKGPSPLGAWAAGLNASSDSVHIRSLEFPGYFFFHDLEDGSYGGAYFGEGGCNRDLGFML